MNRVAVVLFAIVLGCCVKKKDMLVEVQPVVQLSGYIDAATQNISNEYRGFSVLLSFSNYSYDSLFIESNDKLFISDVNKKTNVTVFCKYKKSIGPKGKAGLVYIQKDDDFNRIFDVNGNLKTHQDFKQLLESKFSEGLVVHGYIGDREVNVYVPKEEIQLRNFIKVSPSAI